MVDTGLRVENSGLGWGSTITAHVSEGVGLCVCGGGGVELAISVLKHFISQSMVKVGITRASQVRYMLIYFNAYNGHLQIGTKILGVSIILGADSIRSLPSTWIQHCIHETTSNVYVTPQLF